LIVTALTSCLELPGIARVNGDFREYRKPLARTVVAAYFDKIAPPEI